MIVAHWPCCLASILSAMAKAHGARAASTPGAPTFRSRKRASARRVGSSSASRASALTGSSPVRFSVGLGLAPFLFWRLSDAGPSTCIHGRARAGVRKPSLKWTEDNRRESRRSAARSVVPSLVRQRAVALVFPTGGQQPVQILLSIRLSCCSMERSSGVGNFHDIMGHPSVLVDCSVIRLAITPAAFERRHPPARKRRL